MRLRYQALMFALVLLLAYPAAAQWRSAADIQEGARGSVTGTVADVDEARNEIQLEADDDVGPRITVMSDSVSTQYLGFGGLINGQAEIFMGTQGMANVRTGDRVEVRGIGAGNNAIRADVVTLRGRQVAAPQTGVGQTRTPNSISTPTSTTTTSSARVAPLEGVVQDVNAPDGRIVIVTDRREVLTVRTSAATPVTYRNQTYRVANLEVGDRIRVTPRSGTSPNDELWASAIEVTHSSQEGAPVSRATSVSGRVSRIDRSLDIVNIDTGRVSVRVDVASATDTDGRRVRALDFRSGDRVEVTGRYSPTAADLFIAGTVRFGDEGDNAPPASAGTGSSVDVYGAPAPVELGVVTIYGTIRGTLADSPQLVVRDSAGRSIRIDVVEDFVVRGKGTTTTADHLRAGESVTIKAFRDAAGNYIAQTIRLR